MEWVEHTPNPALSIQSYQNQTFEINGQLYNHAIILGDEVCRLPEKNIADLTLAHFQDAIAAQVRLIIMGTGEQVRFLSPQVQVALAQHGVGVECMNTAAACRTLSMLQAEGRRAWAWLWVA